MTRLRLFTFLAYIVFVIYATLVITLAFTVKTDPFPSVELNKTSRFNMQRLE